MKHSSKKILSVAVAAAIYAPMAAWATNGMNLEGYGPIALGMGGASMAYDNGTAAVMNNPATIGLMSDGSRLDVALGKLGPNVESENTSGKESSSATAFYMPAAGWVKKNGQLAYGVGMFAQGGMGAEYDGGSAVDQSAVGINLMGGNSDSHDQRSELGVGRLLFPVAFNVNDKLTVGGSLDYVWGGLDILWSMDARNFLGAIDGSKVDDGGTGKLAVLGGMIGSQNNRAFVSGTLVDRFVQGFDTTGGVGAPNGMFNNFYWGNFEFSDSSDFTQETFGSGFAGKIGFAYKVNNNLTVGGTYHLKTAMSDFKGDVTATFKVDTTAMDPAGAGTREIPVTGEIKVKDFEWPATLGLGLAYQASDKLMIAADWKRLKWSDVMKDFHMVITADSAQGNAYATGFADSVLDFVYPQEWDDQNVIQLGLSYQYSDAVTLRAGYNHASNPVPDEFVNFLFPAIVENHYTTGIGYVISKASSVDFALSYVPEVKVTESTTETNNLGTTPATTITHSQTSWQFMYSHRF
jgi:long-chain fatty acid transport protein